MRNLSRRAQPLVRVGRRHLHVDHDDVGLVGSDLAQQVLGIAGLADDLEAHLVQEPGQALTEQYGVVGDHHAHGGETLAGRRALRPARTA